MFCILFVVSGNIANLIAQDLKWGFEDWHLIDSIETPVGWDVNHYSNGLGIFVDRFFKDSVHVVQGNYSLKAIKDDVITSAFFNCTSMAQLYMELESPIQNNKSVFFSVMTESLNEWEESYIAITIGFSKDNDFLGRLEWSSYVEIEEFVQIELPILFEGANALSIQIDAASQNGALDGCNLESIVWLDDLRIDQATSLNVSTNNLEEFLGYPNPTNGVFTLSSSGFNGQVYKITDLMNKEIQSGVVLDEQIILEHNGWNIIQIISDDQVPRSIMILKVE